MSEGKNIFLTGGAGVGKSFLLRALIAQYELEGKKVVKLASTGMAASLIMGQTLHSFFSLGICNHSFDLERVGKISIDQKLSKLLKKIDLIVIDEISMVSSGVMDMIRLRLLQADSHAQLIVSGDFLQLPPVIRENDKNRFAYENPDILIQSIYGFAFESEAWQRFEFTNYNLSEVKRSTDEKFIDILDKIRYGIKNKEVVDYLSSLIRPMPSDMQNHTVLFGKNASVHRHNKAELSELEGEMYSFETRVETFEKNVKDNEIERFMNDSRLPLCLKLKINAPILFMRNSWNYFNGEKGIIVRINEEENFIHVMKDDGKLVRVEQERYSKKQWKEKLIEGKKQEIEVSRFDVFQYPLSLAYAITIHKSQGMSLLDLVINLDEIFAPSQFYVGISRAISPHRLSLLPPRRPIESFIFASKNAISFYSLK
ncbi:AAA family ATPase [Sulfurimonas sp. MAG313]|nr:AAA family ATPase [Sulfurimonas sp. MAG313]